MALRQILNLYLEGTVSEFPSVYLVARFQCVICVSCSGVTVQAEP